MSIVSPEGFYGAFTVMRKCIDRIEDMTEYMIRMTQDSNRREGSHSRDGGDIPERDGDNKIYRVTCLCEPQLGKRGLVPTMSSKETYQETLAMKDVLAYADGTNTVDELAGIIEQPLPVVKKVVEQLLEAGLLEEV